MAVRVQWFYVLLVAFVVAGCSGDGTTLGPDGRPESGAESGDGMDGGAPEFPPTDITLGQITTEIFAASCAFPGCHAGGSPSGNLSLEADFVAGELIGVASNQVPDLKRVDPGNPDGSYLLMKVRGTEGIANSQMPLGGTLTDAQIEMIREWIAGGAPLK